MTEKPMIQRYKQASSKKYDTYVTAKMVFNTISDERKRIRRRADGTYDLVIYEYIKVADPADPA